MSERTEELQEQIEGLNDADDIMIMTKYKKEDISWFPIDRCKEFEIKEQSFKKKLEEITDIKEDENKGSNNEEID